MSGEEFSQLNPNDQRLSLLVAVTVCSLSWVHRLDRPKRPFLWHWLVKRMDFTRATFEFWKYRQEGSTFPPLPSEEVRDMADGKAGEEEKGREMGSPFLARLYSFVSSLPDREVRLYGDTAFDYPMGLATFLYFSAMERDGSMRVMNSKEQQIADELDEHKQAIAERKMREGQNG